jgi:hypothetical protein
MLGVPAGGVPIARLPLYCDVDMAFGVPRDAIAKYPGFHLLHGMGAAHQPHDVGIHMHAPGP